LIIKPSADLKKSLAQEFRIQMNGIGQCKVQVFGEAIRFEIAFFQASAALEYPRVLDRRMLINTGQKPAESVVFLYDLNLKAKIAGNLLYLTRLNHAFFLQPKSRAPTAAKR